MAAQPSICCLEVGTLKSRRDGHFRLNRYSSLSDRRQPVWFLPQALPGLENIHAYHRPASFIPPLLSYPKKKKLADQPDCDQLLQLLRGLMATALP